MQYFRQLPEFVAEGFRNDHLSHAHVFLVDQTLTFHHTSEDGPPHLVGNRLSLVFYASETPQNPEYLWTRADEQERQRREREEKKDDERITQDLCRYSTPSRLPEQDLSNVPDPVIMNSSNANANYETRSGGDSRRAPRQSMAELKLRRLQELNGRLRDDLERRRVPVSEAAVEYVLQYIRCLTITDMPMQSDRIYRQGAKRLHGAVEMGTGQ